MTNQLELTLERINIKAFVLPDETTIFHVLLHEVALGIIGSDNAILLALFLELSSNVKDYSSLSRVLRFECEQRKPMKIAKSIYLPTCLILLLPRIIHMDKPTTGLGEWYRV